MQARPWSVAEALGVVARSEPAANRIQPLGAGPSAADVLPAGEALWASGGAACGAGSCGCPRRRRRRGSGCPATGPARSDAGQEQLCLPVQEGSK